MRWLPIALAAALASAVTAVATEDSRVPWPVFVSSKRTEDVEACRAIPGDKLRVVEDGAVVEAIGLRANQPKLHVLIIGNGVDAEHEGMLRWTLEAVAGHIDRLPDRDSLMLLSMGSTLRLVAPPQPLASPGAREGLKGALGGIGVSGRGLLAHWFPALLDTLGDYPQRKVIVNFANPRDYGLMLSSTDLTVAADTAVYSVQFVRDKPDPGRATGDPFNNREVLIPTREWFGGISGVVARKSGGKLLVIDQPRKIADRLRDLRRYLADDGTAIWIPAVFDLGPKDRRGDVVHVRKLRIRSLDKRCRVESAVDTFTSRPLRRAPADELAGVRSVLPLPGRVPLPESLRPTPKGMQSGLVAREGKIEGVFIDVAREDPFSTDLYAGASLSPAGGAPRVAVGRPRSDVDIAYPWRRFQIAVPSFAELTSGRLSRPEDILLYWWRNPEASPEDFRVHGRTMLVLRDPIALALHAYYAGYQEWARKRVRSAIAARLGELYAERTPEERVVMTDERMLRLTAKDLRPHLAAWLGDVGVIELTAAVERRAINDWLAKPAGSRDEAVQLADLVEARWPEIETLFPASDAVTVMAPLVPLYDVERDRIGFYRVILERPTTAGTLPGVPAPFMLRFLRAAVPAGLPSLAVERLDYRFGGLPAEADDNDQRLPTRVTVRATLRGTAGAESTLDVGFETDGPDSAWTPYCANAPAGFPSLVAVVEPLEMPPCGAP